VGEDDPLAAEKSFRRSYDSLPEIFAFVEAFFDSRGIDRGHLASVDLIVEELFTNMVKYCPGNTHEILIGLERSGRRIAVSLTDFDVDPFDINDAPEPDVDRPITERKPGGLGLHIVKRMVERIDYEYADRKSKTTVIKALE